MRWHALPAWTATTEAITRQRSRPHAASGKFLHAILDMCLRHSTEMLNSTIWWAGLDRIFNVDLCC